MYSQQEANGSQKEQVDVGKTSSSSAPMPTRSSIKSAKEKPTMHVDFAGNGKRKKEENGEGKATTKVEAENEGKKVVEDSFEQVLNFGYFGHFPNLICSYCVAKDSTHSISPIQLNYDGKIDKQKGSISFHFCQI
jgi:hypothetical protein